MCQFVHNEVECLLIEVLALIFLCFVDEEV